MDGNKPTGKIAAIAPRFSLPGLDSHQSLMSIRRDQLVYRNHLTEVRPLLRKIDDSTAANDSAPLFIEWLVWDLAGCHVKYDVIGNAKVEGFDQFLNLLKLEQLQGRDHAAFSEAALAPGQRGRSSAVIMLSAGQGTASHVLPDSIRTEVTLYTSRDASNNSTDHPVPNADDPLKLDPCDILDVAVDLPKNQDTLTITLTRSDGSHGKITVATQRRDPVTGVVTEFVPTVCFSHLCSQLPAPRPFDLEFAQYYDMLKTNPHDNALVPYEGPTAGSVEGDCDFPAMIDYQVSTAPNHPRMRRVAGRKKAETGKKIKTRKGAR
jgi:hypothetical protein